MCCGVVTSDLTVRVAEDEFDAVMRGPHVRPMDFTGRPLGGFVQVSPPGLRSAAALRAWPSRDERIAEQMAAEPAEPSAPGKTRSGTPCRPDRPPVPAA